MSKLKRILAIVAPDMRPTAATRRATELARRSGARLDLFMPVYDRHIEAAEQLAEEDVARRAREHYIDERTRGLTTWAKELADQGLNVSCEVSWAREAYEAIIGRALDDSPDVVVVDLKHGAFLHRKAIIQTSNWRLARLCPAPLMLVQEDSPPLPHRISAAVDPTHTGAYPSGLNEQVVEAGLSVTSVLETELELIHVFPYLSADSDNDTSELNTAARRLRLEHELAFGAFADQYSIRRDKCKLLLGEPAESLMKHLESQRIDLLVLGSQYRTGLDRLLLGSNAEALIAQATCDLLLVRPRGFAESLKRDATYRHLMKTREVEA